MKNFSILAALAVASLTATPALAAPVDALSVRAAASVESENNLGGLIGGWVSLAVLAAVVVGAILITGEDETPVSP